MKSWSVLLSVLLFVGALAWGCAKSTTSVTAKPDASPKPEHYGPTPGAFAPLVTFVDQGGEELNLEQLRGSVVLLNFWATWCAPCVEEMPSLQTLHDELGASGLHIVAVSVDAKAEDAFAFAKENDLTLPMLFDRKQAAANAYQVRTIPITFLIDRDGKIVSKVRGTRDWTSQEMKDQIQDLLRQSS